MTNPAKICHRISYLQYPLLVVAIDFYVPFNISMFNKAIGWSMLNYMLIFFGVALSIST